MIKNRTGIFQEINPLHVWIVYSIVLLILITPILGFGAFFVLWVSLSFGVREYICIKLRNKKHEPENIEINGLTLRFFLFVVAPFLTYSYAMYHIHHNGYMSDFYEIYMHSHDKFRGMAERLYPTIHNHYNIINEARSESAKILIHIYSVCFFATSIMFLVMSALAVASAMNNRSHKRETKTKERNIVSLVLSVIFIVIPIVGILFQFDAPTKLESSARGISFDVSSNDKFLYHLTFITPVYLLMTYYFVNELVVRISNQHRK